MNSSVKKEEDWLEDSLQVILAFAYYSTGSLRECLTHTKDNKKGSSLTPYKIYLQGTLILLLKVSGRYCWLIVFRPINSEVI